MREIKGLPNPVDVDNPWYPEIADAKHQSIVSIHKEQHGLDHSDQALLLHLEMSLLDLHLLEIHRVKMQSLPKPQFRLVFPLLLSSALVGLHSSSSLSPSTTMLMTFKDLVNIKFSLSHRYPLVSSTSTTN